MDVTPLLQSFILYMQYTYTIGIPHFLILYILQSSAHTCLWRSKSLLEFFLLSSGLQLEPPGLSPESLPHCILHVLLSNITLVPNFH